MNEIKALIIDDGNVDIVEEGLETFIQAVNDFKNVHHSVQKLQRRREKRIMWTGMSHE